MTDSMRIESKSLIEVVPPVMLGNSREPRSVMERGSVLIAYCEAAGLDPLSLNNPDVDYVLTYRLRKALGV